MITIPLPPEIYPACCIFAFIMGAFLGSFYNVCIYRIPMGMSVNKPRRSFCFRCGSMVKWFDNLPIVSYFMLRGRCRHCGSRYSARYMLIELLTGLIFVAIFIGANPPQGGTLQVATFWYLAFASLLIVGTFTDIDHYIIPEQVTIGGTIAALVGAVIISICDPWPLLASAGPFPAVTMGAGREWYDVVEALLKSPFTVPDPAIRVAWWAPIANAVIGAAFGFFMLYGIGIVGKIVFRKDAMGFGDVKLFAMIGATLGVTGCLVTLALASIFGVVDGLARQVGKLIGTVRKVAGEDQGILAAGALPHGGGEGVPPLTDAQKAIGRLVEINRNTPRSRPVHYLPFGPSIALAAVIEVIFLQRIYLWLWNVIS
ncbi:prepilin peptidase [Candidatus Sumerlaeota bacterium]|nr:prepilin peptidase [Candidatus Sumerlaeota bacterium]